jgi:hypothetical protein
MLSLKIPKAEVHAKFQDGRCRHFGNLSACYKMGNYHRTLMKIGTQTKQNMLIECKSHKSGSLRQKTGKN